MYIFFLSILDYLEALKKITKKGDMNFHILLFSKYKKIYLTHPPLPKKEPSPVFALVNPSKTVRTNKNINVLDYIYNIRIVF